MDDLIANKEPCFLIYGCNGQDGKILFSILKYIYPSSTFLLASRTRLRINSQNESRTIISSQMHDDIIRHLLKNIKFYSPDRIYYFAAQHQSSSEFRNDGENNVAALNYTNQEIPFQLMDSCISNKISTKFIYASSALIYSDSRECPQNENTQPNPTCLYGESKVNASRQLDELIASKTNNCQLYNLILYGHESIYRSEKFFTKKLINHLLASSTKTKYDKKLFYNPDILLDIGYAPEYMIFSEKIICESRPGNYIISSGCQIKLRDFVQSCCNYFDLEINSVVNFQDAEPRTKTVLFGDASKARRNIGFEPKVTGTKLASIMCEDAQVNSIEKRIIKMTSSILKKSF